MRKMLNIMNHYGIESQNYNEISPWLVKIAITRNTRSNIFGKDMEKKKKKRNPCPWLVGVYTGLVIIKILLLLLSRFSHVWLCATHRRQPTRLPHPLDSPGKNTGVGCHFLLQCMKVKSESEVAQSCPTLCNPMDCSLPGYSIHGIFQARVLEWVAIAFSIIKITKV